ncbi:OmpA/MotB family protein [Mucilaginibacter polytrichastri]|nr:OmpA family protein [Mucilaginibacter polytrichastri]SFS69185.1 chemotaxis protein MotB [Mucilaginibacter polytrichastri]
MIKLRYLLIGVVLCATMHSCKVMSTKAYKSMVAERDSLSTRTTSLEAQVDELKADTARMHRALAELNTKYNELNDGYNLLNASYTQANSKLNKTSSQVSQLSSDLQKREARLKEVEDILKRRDEATNALKAKLQQALLGFQQSGLSVDIRDGKVYVSLTDKLLFPSGSIVIDDKGKAALKQVAVVLNKEPNINLAIEGHTDDKKVLNLGQIKDNWDLSVLRATSVSRYMVETENMDPKRITATGKGQYQPIDPANTPEARARNRRIEIVLTPKLDELYNLITK